MGGEGFGRETVLAKGMGFWQGNGLGKGDGFGVWRLVKGDRFEEVDGWGRQ